MKSVFDLFCFLTLSRLYPEYIEEKPRFNITTLWEKLTADNFENRLFARRFTIKILDGKKYSWLRINKILVTPKSPEDFIEWLKKNDVPFIDNSEQA